MKKQCHRKSPNFPLLKILLFIIIFSKISFGQDSEDLEVTGISTDKEFYCTKEDLIKITINHNNKDGYIKIKTSPD